MRQRAFIRFRPALERFEAKHLLSAGALRAELANLRAASALQSAAGQPALATRFVVSRITNPTPFNAQLIPPFAQVLVQAAQPVPGAVYNILSLSMRNSTSQTFNASSGFTVGVSKGSRAFPILTGSEQWKPGQVMVFYILTEQYYPLRPAVSSGFVFNLAGSAGIAIPGPSGIFLRVRYNPATFPAVLDHIVAFGTGAKGHLLGLPDTAIWEFTGAKGQARPHRPG